MASRKQALQDFQTLLLSIEGLAALVNGRVYSGQPPQGAPLPTLTLTVISAPTTYSHDGHESDETLMQIDIDGHSPTQCRDIADSICDGISGIRTAVGGTRFEGIFHDDVEIASVSESNVPGTTQAHRLAVDYRLLHRPLDGAVLPGATPLTVLTAPSSVIVVGTDGAEYEETTYPDGTTRYKPVYTALP